VGPNAFIGWCLDQYVVTAASHVLITAILCLPPTRHLALRHVFNVVLRRRGQINEVGRRGRLGVNNDLNNDKTARLSVIPCSSVWFQCIDLRQWSQSIM